MADIFVSYSSHDRTKAVALCDKLRATGMSVWIDESNISAATQWTDEIVAAINECKIFIILLSHFALESHNVIKEIKLASEKKKYIIPVELEQVHLTHEVEYQLVGIQRVPFKQTERILEAAAHFLEVPLSSAEPRKRRMRMTILLLFLIFLAAMLFFVMRNPRHDLVLKEKSLVVLPFTSISSNINSNQLAAGFTDELTLNLERVGELLVTSFKTAKEYLHQSFSPKQIADELHVSYVLRGEMEDRSDGVSITIHLIEGSTGEEVWNNSYSIPMAKLPMFKDSLANELLHLFKLKSITSNSSYSKIDPDAYRLYVRAKGVNDTGVAFTLEVTKRRLNLCDEAIKLDSNYASAYSLKGLLISQISRYNGNKEPYTLEKAREFELKAMLLDPKLPEIYQSLGFIFLWMNRFADFVSANRTAATLAPNDPEMLMGYADALSMNHDPLAAQYADQAIRLDPTSISRLTIALVTYDRLHDSTRYMQTANNFFLAYERYHRAYPDDLSITVYYVSLLITRGDIVKANTILEELLQRNAGKDIVLLYNISCSYSRLGEKKRSLDILEQVLKAMPLQKEFAKHDRDFDALRDDPRFKRLVGLK